MNIDDKQLWWFLFHIAFPVASIGIGMVLGTVVWLAFRGA